MASLDDTQAKVLQNAIIEFLVAEGGKLHSLVGVELAAQVSPNETHAGLARLAVDSCLREGAVLVQVLRGLDRQRLNADLVALWKLADSWQPSPRTPPFSALALGEDEPFVDREGLRARLRALLGDEAQPILAVNGDAGLGKRYSAAFVADEANLNGRFKIAHIAVDASSAAIWGAEDVALEVVRAVSARPSPQPLHPVAGDRHAALLADWTAIEVAHANQPLWLALVGFDHKDIPKATSLYVDELLTMLGKDPRMSTVRLLLFGFDLERLEGLTDRYDKALLHLPTESELKAYFKAVFPVLPAFHWETAAAQVLHTVPDSGPARMMKLQLNVKRTHHVLG